jgi:hypothetical protein
VSREDVATFHEIAALARRSIGQNEIALFVRARDHAALSA